MVCSCNTEKQIGKIKGLETKGSRDVLKAILRSKQAKQSAEREIRTPLPEKPYKRDDSGSNSRVSGNEVHLSAQSVLKSKLLKKRISPSSLNAEPTKTIAKVESRASRVLNDMISKKAVVNSQKTSKEPAASNQRASIQSFLKVISDRKDQLERQTASEYVPQAKNIHYRSRELLARITSFDSKESPSSEKKKAEPIKSKKPSILFDLANIYSRTDRIQASKRSLNLTMEKEGQSSSSRQLKDVEEADLVKDLLDHGEDPIPSPPLNTQIELPNLSQLNQILNRPSINRPSLRKAAKKPLGETKNQSVKSLLSNQSNKKPFDTHKKNTLTRMKTQEAEDEPQLMYFMDFIRFGGVHGQHKESKYVEHICTSFTMFKQLGHLIEKGKRNPKPHRPVVVPAAPGCQKILILFDIDETLVHCDIRNVTKTFDTRTRIQISDPYGRKIVVGELLIEAKVNIRPFAKQLIESLSSIFDIGVFTAAIRPYAKEIVSYFDPHKKHIKVVLSREDCQEIYPNVYVKDLRIIKDRDPSKVFLVDNCAYSYAYQIDNGIPIVSYHEGKDDTELQNLEQYLKLLSSQSDPLAFNRGFFKTHVMNEQNSFPEAFSRLMQSSR